MTVNTQIMTGLKFVRQQLKNLHKELKKSMIIVSKHCYNEHTKNGGPAVNQNVEENYE